MRELYEVEISPALISEITADLDKEVTAWRTRPLEAVWPIVYFDGIVVHVRGTQRTRLAAHDLRGFGRESCKDTRSCLGSGWARTKGPSFG